MHVYCDMLRVPTAIIVLEEIAALRIRDCIACADKMLESSHGENQTRNSENSRATMSGTSAHLLHCLETNTTAKVRTLHICFAFSVGSSSNYHIDVCLGGVFFATKTYAFCLDANAMALMRRGMSLELWVPPHMSRQYVQNGKIVSNHDEFRQFGRKFGVRSHFCKIQCNLSSDWRRVEQGIVADGEVLFDILSDEGRRWTLWS
ncbi:hypothetical protein F5050DRAFT_1709881 [Lentinula boryana]|uniref:Uncharacterized protein n=1 Tax=Lentinula boryana TaxID=40481 RepID=A0ABQ8QKU9_9AGAR|nr:hypothetical protein F5050DRAFT_1709881 [Lentinula boryana]